jgi:ATP-dependent DNA ligase
MLAKLADELPVDGNFLFEPKWDGFRAIVFRGASEVFIQSRDLRPFDRYFPDLHDELLERLPKGCVIDGEIVITTPHVPGGQAGEGIAGFLRGVRSAGGGWREPDGGAA